MARQTDLNQRGQRLLYGSIGVIILLMLWQLGHYAYGSLVLPGLPETCHALIGLFEEDRAVPALLTTAGNAIAGWLLGSLVGILAGSLAGLREKAQWMLKPIAIIFLGVPAIAWVVLALLWFGGRWAVIFTVAVAISPLIFAAASQGVRSLDEDLVRMARSFKAPPLSLALDVYGPHMLSYLFPALATTLAMSWKIAVMAELLSGSGGIGDGIAAARAQVDTAETMAWVLMVVVALIIVDHLIINPIQTHMETWRSNGRSSRS